MKKLVRTDGYILDQVKFAHCELDRFISTQEGGDDLAVGAPSKQLGSSPQAGIVHVLYGSPSGLGNNFVFANHTLAQGISDLDDIIETEDFLVSPPTCGASLKHACTIFQS
jgi:hypothetical protein